MGSGEKFGRAAAEWDQIVSRCVEILEDVARARTLTAYSDLAERITGDLGLAPPVDHHLELSHVLYDAVLLGFESWPDRASAPSRLWWSTRTFESLDPLPDPGQTTGKASR